MIYNKAIDVLATIATSVIICTLIILGLMLFMPVKTIDIDSPMRILNESTIVTGESVSVEVHYTKYIDAPAIVSRQFINDVIVLTPSTMSDLPVGENTIVQVVPVPREMPTGIYYIRYSISYQVNPVRTVNLDFITEPFYVKHEETNAQ